MAQQYIHDITIDTGITAEQVLAEFPCDVIEGDNGKLYAQGRKSENMVRAWAARHAADQHIEETGTEPTTKRPAAPITERQINYIMTLIGRGAHEEGGFISGPAPTYQELQAWDRRTASAYIDSLTGNY